MRLGFIEASRISIASGVKKARERSFSSLEVIFFAYSIVVQDLSHQARFSGKAFLIEDTSHFVHILLCTQAKLNDPFF